MKVVFLIDVKEEACRKRHFAEVVLVALRLLSFFSNGNCADSFLGDYVGKKQQIKDTISRSTKKSVLKWGFKFFSSHGTVLRSKLNKKTSSFTETCNQESFKIFQKKAELVFCDETVETTCKRKSLTHPSDQLNTALTEILHDFEWEDKSDPLKSPARIRSSRKRVHSVLDDETHLDEANIVFILSKAPSSRQHLRQFANKVVIDSDVFIDSFMSPALLSEYREKSKINVHWIDFNNSLCDDTSQLNEKCTAESLQNSLIILKNALNKLGGNLLHKNDILNEFPSDTTLPNFSEAHPPLELCPTEARLWNRLLTSHNGSSDICQPEITTCLRLSGSRRLVKLDDAKLSAFVNSDLEICAGSYDENSSTLEDDPNAPEAVGQLDWSKAEIELEGYISTSAGIEIMKLLDMHQSTTLTCDSQSKTSMLLSMLVRTQHLGILKMTSTSAKTPPHMAVLSVLTSTRGRIFCLTWNQQIDLESALLLKSNSNNLFSSSKTQPEESVRLKKDANSSNQQSEGIQFKSEVLNSWHKPGSSQILNPLIRNLRRNDNTQPYSAEEVMASLKTLYMKAKQNHHPILVASTPVSEPSTVKVGCSGDSDPGFASVRRLSRRSSSSLSRGRLMVDRARSARDSFAGDEDSSNQSSKPPSPGARRTSGSAGFENLNIENEEELVTALQKQYSQVLGAGVAMEASIQAMVAVACYFMSTKGNANPQNSAVAFIHKHLVLDPSKLKEKYGKSDDVDKKSQAIEYKLQVILLIEMASLVPDNEDLHGDKLVTKLVSIFRVLSFIIGPTSLQEFMANVAESYSGTLPKVLMDVFDELDLPYPACLAKLASPSALSSVWGANMSVGSLDSYVSGPGSSQPPSVSQQSSQGGKRSRLKPHPSLSDFRQKKQILVEKPKAKPVSKSEGRKSAKDKDKGKQKPRGTKSRHGVDYGRAKRNLFSDKSKASQSSKTKDKRQLTPKRKSGKAKLLVPGTPAHKQTSERILSRQKRLREHLNIKPEVQVVAESPLKDVEDPIGSVDNRPARFILRESFYSSSSSRQSRIVAKSMELAERGESQPASSQRFLQPTKSQGSLMSAVRGESPILSPRTSMMRSFLSSPVSDGKRGSKKIPTTPTTPTHLPRRSPRKSVKKLLFQNTDHDQVKTDGRKNTPSSLNAQLVFDGENASDALPTRSPVKRHGISVQGFKTPEKRKVPSRCDWWDSASCPALQVTPTKAKGRRPEKTPDLDFKSFFNSQPSTSSSQSPMRSFRNSPSKVATSHNSPAKSKSLYNSPKGKSLNVNTSVSSKLNRFASSNEISNRNSSINRKTFETKKKNVISSSQSTLDEIVRARKNSLSELVNSDDVVLSTPKKTKHKSDSSYIHSTPSKVTFSESCLLSPPTGSGRPVSTTPQRSILKGSPAAKRTSFAHRIEFSQMAGPSNSNSIATRMQSFSCETNSSVVSKGKVYTNIIGTKDNTSSISLKTDHVRRSSSQNLRGEGLSGKEESTKPSLSSCPDYDSSSSNSSHCNDSQVAGERPSASTVVTAHTPSPSNKCKTPDSINKWVRKKRPSGSKTLSSSSSSSSCSNDSRDKSLGQKATRSASTAPDDCGNQTSSAQGEEKTLKRNLFSIGSSTTALTSPSPKKRKVTAAEKTNKGNNMNVKLPSYRSEGFSHNSECVPNRDPEALSLHKRPTTEAVTTAMVRRSSGSHHSSQSSLFPTSSSPYKKPTLMWSSSLGEGSQGFLVQSDTGIDTTGDGPFSSSSSSVQHTSVKSSKKPSHEGKVEHQPNVISQSLSCPKSSSPSNPNKSPTTPKKKQFSPALSTSGLLQLIGSPLLEGQERQTRRPNKNSDNPRSRKHLDWP